MILVAAGLFAAAALARDTALQPVSEDEFDEASWNRLRAGEVLLRNTRMDESGGSARVTALVHADVERLWAVLTSCERSFDYVDGMRICEVLEGGLERAVARQAVKKAWIMPRLDYTIQFDRQPYRLIEFHKLDGDLKLLEGRWEFSRVADSGALLVTHEIRVQPRIPAPRWLIRRSIRKDIPDMLACLRSLVSGSGTEQLQASDSRRCPKTRRKGR